jgi:hypothetical protein
MYQHDNCIGLTKEDQSTCLLRIAWASLFVLLVYSTRILLSTKRSNTQITFIGQSMQVKL